MQQFISLDDRSLTHLSYEQRLIELADGGGNPEIGGKPFIITDDGPPTADGDWGGVFEMLTDPRFRVLSPTPRLLLVYIAQAHHLTTHSLFQSPNVFLRTAGTFPPRLLLWSSSSSRTYATSPTLTSPLIVQTLGLLWKRRVGIQTGPHVLGGVLSNGARFSIEAGRGQWSCQWKWYY